MKIHNLGLPRIGKKRELKKALEQYWKGNLSEKELNQTTLKLKEENWEVQLKNNLDFITVADYSLYDHILDTSTLFGNIPERFKNLDLNNIDLSFAIARGFNKNDDNIIPSEMKKWFNTNYHYIVPEFSRDTEFKLNSTRIITEINEAINYGVPVDRLKPVIVGPLTYLWLGKSDINRLDLLPLLLFEYKKLISELKNLGIQWIQIDEPILTLDKLDKNWELGFKSAYQDPDIGIHILLTTYFESTDKNIELIADLNIQGIHFDIIDSLSGKLTDISEILKLIPHDKLVSLGLINGRNIWLSNLENIFSLLKPLEKHLRNKLWIAPSCSLLHLPVTIEPEKKLLVEHTKYLSFAYERIQELNIIKKVIQGKLPDSDLNTIIMENTGLIASLKKTRDCNNNVKYNNDCSRKSPYKERRIIQEKTLDLPILPTTTIGSFPQTPEIRRSRYLYRSGKLSANEYEKSMKDEIKKVIRIQEDINLDVLVHGEPERTDMVEYFADILNGYLVTSYGWVQSYGSRCVKPAIIYSDIIRKQAMTVKWLEYAQSITKKHVKGMLTGPITMLKWAFVREDIPYFETAEQVAMAINSEVLDLVSAGIKIIQIDEAALKEALPIKKEHWNSYINNAARVFRLCSKDVGDEIQIHTHMCYSNFDDIMDCISLMDSDVITIETTRSQMKILSKLKKPGTVNGIGPGVYDIHSANIPSPGNMEQLIKKALEVIDSPRLWINPDCGLKTRSWKEVIPSLKNMVNATLAIRSEL